MRLMGPGRAESAQVDAYRRSIEKTVIRSQRFRTGVREGDGRRRHSAILKYGIVMSEATITTMPTSSEATISELRELLREAEAILGDTGSAARDKVDELRQRLRAALVDVQSATQRLRQAARRQAEELDEQVRSHPYQAIGIAAGIGALVGVAVSRIGH